MRIKLYHILVNRRIGIAQRYHKVHDGTQGIARLLSYIYLLWINIAYYLLFCRWLGKALSVPVYEEKRLPVKKPESSLIRHETPEKLAKRLLVFDIISFDIFDTLILRPFSEPTDLFYFIGEKLGYMDFKRIRMEAEHKARMLKFKKEESFEVSLREIWEQLEKMTGIDATEGMETELETELSLCYANPYMSEVFHRLRKQGKRIVLTSDMYLEGKTLETLLKKNGLEGYEKIFVSCEMQKAKGDGKLFSHVKTVCSQGSKRRLSFAHIGDNKGSDIKMAEKQGFTAFWYPNVNQNTILYRAYDMSPVIGGAYRGLVNNRIYNGTEKYSQNYEYGYIYGGLFILGFCNFIHQYCKNSQVDKILFIARDGEIIQKVYQKLYPEDDTAYVYLSRLAAVKLTAGYYKYDYLRKMIRHKAGENLSFSEILKGMELSALGVYLADFVPERIEKRRQWKPMKLTDALTYANADDFIEFINVHWDKVLEQYAEQRKAAGIWYRNIIGEAKRAAAIDIGWAGSGALALKTLFEKEWKISCKLTGIVAGTNTIHNAEPDISEVMLLDGTLCSYLYSSANNREIWKKHNPARMYNIYFELLTSSAHPSFKGFYLDRQGRTVLRFQKPEGNQEGIRDIQAGILDFANDYLTHFKNFPFMFHISGRDAYAPMLLAAGYGERYLKQINKSFTLSIGL